MLVKGANGRRTPQGSQLEYLFNTLFRLIARKTSKLFCKWNLSTFSSPHKGPVMRKWVSMSEHRHAICRILAIKIIIFLNHLMADHTTMLTLYAVYCRCICFTDLIDSYPSVVRMWSSTSSIQCYKRHLVRPPIYWTGTLLLGKQVDGS